MDSDSITETLEKIDNTASRIEKEIKLLDEDWEKILDDPSIRVKVSMDFDTGSRENVDGISAKRR